MLSNELLKFLQTIQVSEKTEKEEIKKYSNSSIPLSYLLLKVNANLKSN